MDDLLNLDACSLPTADRPLRLAEFDDLFRDAVRSVERSDRTVRLRLAGGRGLTQRVRDLTSRESQCCSFFAFTLDGTDDSLDLTISVTPEHADVLAALAQRAESLSA